MTQIQNEHIGSNAAVKLSQHNDIHLEGLLAWILLLPMIPTHVNYMILMSHDIYLMSYLH